MQSFKPDTNYPGITDDAKAVSCPLGNYFQIPVKIFGETNFMIVDTGSSHAILDAAYRGRLGESLTLPPSVDTTSSKVSFEFRECPEIYIADTRFAPLLAVVSDLEPLRRDTGEPILGIVGLSCLKYGVVCFDSDQGTFSIGGSVPAEVKQNALALPLIEKSSFEFGINAFINGHGPILLSMDSGNAVSISLNKSDWQKVFSGQSPNSRQGESLDAEGKFIKDTCARLQRVTVGANSYTNLLADTLANPEILSTFGQGFIRRHVCYVDFPNRLLYLLPGRDFDRPEEYGMSGLGLQKIDGKIVAFSVDEDAPAFQSGIRVNDQILSLNGQDAASLPLKAIYETLKSKPDNEIKMQIKHGAKTNSVTFRLKRLL